MGVHNQYAWETCVDHYINEIEILMDIFNAKKANFFYKYINSLDFVREHGDLLSPMGALDLSLSINDPELIKIKDMIKHDLNELDRLKRIEEDMVKYQVIAKDKSTYNKACEVINDTCKALCHFNEQLEFIRENFGSKSNADDYHYIHPLNEISKEYDY